MKTIGLLCHIHRVDAGSPADECGLRVGDQIIDVNGHDFLNVFHQEAVTVLRSYSTLIMTIKVGDSHAITARLPLMVTTHNVQTFGLVLLQSLGRLPKLVAEETTEQSTQYTPFMTFKEGG